MSDFDRAFAYQFDEMEKDLIWFMWDDAGDDEKRMAEFYRFNEKFRLDREKPPFLDLEEEFGITVAFLTHLRHHVAPLPLATAEGWEARAP